VVNGNGQLTTDKKFGCEARNLNAEQAYRYVPVMNYEL
jgi:hypothetical protein